ncbi:MAG: hypothetical protein AB7F32_11510, partial [Victivallaceae bacterium]
IIINHAVLKQELNNVFGIPCQNNTFQKKLKIRSDRKYQPTKNKTDNPEFSSARTHFKTRFIDCRGAPAARRGNSRPKKDNAVPGNRERRCVRSSPVRVF